MKEAEEYHHHVVVDQADWSAVDQLLALRNITPATVPHEEFMRHRSQYAHGNSGLPIVGDPDHVAGQLIELSRAGLTGVAVSLVNYADELPYFRDEVLPRLQRVGLRLPA
jgi:alkanesulfonate monooxygenase SsuD/methylene tetrahydromethanopterin reductase-like flavin-dependent oxidoreductase (luciferase family)